MYKRFLFNREEFLKILKNIYIRYCEAGLFCTILFYIQHAMDILYGYGMFHKRIEVKWTSRITGSKHMKIGDNFHAGNYLWLSAINTYCAGRIVYKFSPKIIIGNNVSVEDFVHIGCINCIKIGNNVLMGSKIYITDHNHGIYNGVKQSTPLVAPSDRELDSSKSVVIGDNTWIGEFVTILPGTNIGEGCIIGTHSVVVHDIPPYSIAVGVPAKVVKKWNFSLEKWERV